MDPMILATFGIIAVYFVFAFRTQKKSAQQRQDMMNTLRVGSHIVTIGGLHGVVSELDDETVVLDCEGIYLTFERRAIARIVPTPTVEAVEEVVEIAEGIEEPEETHE